MEQGQMITPIKPYWKSGVQPLPADEELLPKDCDVVIVGAGFTGLTTALLLARAGRSVLVLDSHEIGHGCSGRSGGMCGPSFHKLGHSGLIKQYGETKAWALMQEGLNTFEHFVSFIKDEQLDCDLQMAGRFRGAASAKDFDNLCATSELLSQKIGLKYHAVERKNQGEEIGTDLYHGGVVYERDAGVHPYKLTLELARKAREAGVRILEHHKVEGVRADTPQKQVLVKGANITTKDIVIATNGYTGPEFQSLRRRLIPVTSGVVATPDLGPEKIRELTPKLRMHGGTHRLVFWYRPTPDGRRMIFGGRVMDPHNRPKRISADLMSMARTVFPQLHGIDVEYCWHGQVAYTFDHAPHLGQIDGLHYAMGYCGSGVTRSIYFAHQLSRKILRQGECDTIYDDLMFNSKPFYSGNPWFMPMILRWHALADRVAGHR
jgi:glycine/D-amino acid oxidase-like deaminating enzyme